MNQPPNELGGDSTPFLRGLDGRGEDRWAMVASAWRRLAEIRLRCAGLPHPPVLMSAGEVARGKPHSDGYLMAAAALGIPPEECVVIEDAPVGIAAGRAAGMTVIGATTSLSAPAMLNPEPMGHEHATDVVASTIAMGFASVARADEPWLTRPARPSPSAAGVSRPW